MNMKMTQGRRRPRSATAPTARATLYQSVACLCLVQWLVHLRDGGKHALVDRIQQIRVSAASHRGLSQNVHETKVVKSTDELAGLVGKCKRVTPEEPLERDYGRGHDGEPDEREGRLASGQAGVEESAVVISILRTMCVQS